MHGKQILGHAYTMQAPCMVARILPVKQLDSKISGGGRGVFHTRAQRPLGSDEDFARYAFRRLDYRIHNRYFRRGIVTEYPIASTAWNE